MFEQSVDFQRQLTRIGIFYDGNFFSKVSNYYRYSHPRQARISISGLHEFIRHYVAKIEDDDVRRCRIVDAHYFRGRASAAHADERGVLLGERAFDDVLMREGVVTHYLPQSAHGERGIDLWFALETYELTSLKRFDVTVLVAGDSDYVPLARKLNNLDTCVMALHCDVEWNDGGGERRSTRTSQALLDEVTYAVPLSRIIDDPAKRSDPLVNGLFFQSREGGGHKGRDEVSTGVRGTGVIQHIPDGKYFGFITPDDGSDKLFFYGGSVADGDFHDLAAGDAVEFELGSNEQGPCALQVRLAG
ncbi:MAG: cold shock domain-containing protein [Myxococcota bacterium]